MRQRFLLVAVLLACASALQAQQTVTVIDLNLRGDIYYFHRLQDGALMTLKKADVKRISDQPRTPTWAQDLVEIANLPMEGGSQAGPTNAATVRRGGPNPSLGSGFYGNVVPGTTIGMPNSANDYQIGRTFAAPPANAVQSSPGAPPQAPPR
jgi:hypothetical protein